MLYGSNQSHVYFADHADNPSGVDSVAPGRVRLPARDLALHPVRRQPKRPEKRLVRVLRLLDRRRSRPIRHLGQPAPGCLFP